MVTSVVARQTRNAARRGDTLRRAVPGRNRHTLVWFAIPSIVLVLVLVFFITPFILNVPLAFTTRSGYSPEVRFNGLTNFQLLIERGVLQNAVLVTLSFALIGMVIQNIAGLGLALLMQRTTPVNSFFRSLYFMCGTQQAIDYGAQGLLVDRIEAGAELSPELVSIAADDGDALSLSLMQRSARLVGSSIATLVNAFNPSVIVIGGVVAGAGQVFLAEVRRRVYELSLPVATQDLTIVRSADDLREPLRRGMELAREQLFGATFAHWFVDGSPSVRRCTAAPALAPSFF